MKQIRPILLALTVALSSLTVTAQAPAASTGHKYLLLSVEYIKPGKGGAAHDKTESAFVAAVAKAKFPIHYTAYNAITGKSRAIYISRFNSFAEIDAANRALRASAVAPELEKAIVADGELLEETKTLIFNADPELSYHVPAKLSDRHFLEIGIIKIKPGHGKDFTELVKLWQTFNDKAGTSAHWDAYHAEYGEDSTRYVFLTAHKSLADVDTEFADEDKIGPSLTDDDKKRLRELREAAIEEDRTELYSVNPAQSYVDEETIQADPSFWKPKPVVKAAAKPVVKAAAKPAATAPGAPAAPAAKPAAGETKK